MKTYIAFLLMVSCMLLSACSFEGIDNVLKEVAQQKMLGDNSDYSDYITLKNTKADKINNDGYYIPQDISEFDEGHIGKIHVSFASNNFLNINYYSDSEHKEKLDKLGCYLDRGDKIYAVVDMVNRSGIDSYEFNGFQIAAFEGYNVNYNYKRFYGDIITIPEDIQFPEISIIPLGSYNVRKLTFQSEYVDRNGQKENYEPVSWNVIYDGVDHVAYDGYEIKPNAQFRVTTKYDPTKVVFDQENSFPECESVADTEDGMKTIKFKQYEPGDSVTKYSLKFKPSVEFKISKVSCDDGDKAFVTIGNNKFELECDKSYYGESDQEVRITSEKNSINNVEVTNLYRISGDKSWVYKIRNSDEAFTFDPSLYDSQDNGKISFYYNKNKIISPIELKNGDIIECEGKPDNGYGFKLGYDRQEIEVYSESDFIQIMKNDMTFIKKEEKPLPQPKEGGTITYSLNKEKLNGKSVLYYEYDDLKAQFTPEARYKVNNISDEAECIYEGNKLKLKDNDGNYVEVDDVFKISTSQKAKLTVILDESVGTEPKFYIYNGNDEPINKKQQYDVKEAFAKFDSPENVFGIDDNELLNGKEIDSVSDIRISVSDWSPLIDEALRIDVEKIDAADKKNNKIEVYYITSGSGSQTIQTNAGASSYYSEINVNISKVRGSLFKAADYKHQNVKITFKFDDTTAEEKLTDGCFVDNTRKIKMTIKAEDGYTLYEKNFIPIPEEYGKKDKIVEKFKYEDISESFNDAVSDIKAEK